MFRSIDGTGKTIITTALVACAIGLLSFGAPGCSGKKADTAGAASKDSASGSGQVVTVGEGVQTQQHESPADRAKDK